MIEDRRYTDIDIRIDTEYESSVFKSDKMLLNIRARDQTLRAYINGGHQDSKIVGDFPGFFKVWYNKNSMVNILAFSDIRKKFRITMDTNVKSTMNVHLGEGIVMKFKEVESGLYLCSNDNKSNIKNSIHWMDHKTSQDSHQFWEPHKGPMTFVMIPTPTKPMTRYNPVAGLFTSDYRTKFALN